MLHYAIVCTCTEDAGLSLAGQPHVPAVRLLDACSKQLRGSGNTRRKLRPTGMLPTRNDHQMKLRIPKAGARRYSTVDDGDPT